MNLYAMTQAEQAWRALPERERSRSLAASYFAPGKAHPRGGEDDSSYKKKGINAIAGGASVAAYCNHWAPFLAAFPQDTLRSVRAVLRTGLLVNLSGSVLENAGLSLERATGVPIIPDSAVKGLARRYAIALLQESSGEEQEKLLERIIRIFGCVGQDFEPDCDLGEVLPEEIRLAAAELYRNQRGRVSFLPAVPEALPQIGCDVLTPHHTRYMNGELPQPTDTEEPVPSFYPVVRAGATYCFAITAQGVPELLDTAEEWLSKALACFGIGAKGAAGYGYFAVQDKAMATFTPEQQEAITFISSKQKLGDLFKEFHKRVEKEPLKCWALLRAVSLPEGDAACRTDQYREFMQNPPDEKKARNSWKKACEAMTAFAAQHNINLPNV